MVQYANCMTNIYPAQFPVAFSETQRSDHVFLSETDFETICNTKNQSEFEATQKRIDSLLINLNAIRSIQKTTGGEIRIYGRSLHTSQALLKAIHPTIRDAGFVEVIGLSDVKQNWKQFPWPRVAISANGLMTTEDRAMMYEGLDKKILIIMSGGEGRSDQLFYRPIAQLIQTIIEKELFLFAVCMSYQVLADQVVCLGIKRGQNVPPATEGKMRLGTQIADLTKFGKEDVIFGTLAPAFGVESWNHYRIYGHDVVSDQPQKNVQVLARDRATQEIVAFRVGTTTWAIQYHPELKKMARPGKGLQQRASVAMNQDSIIIPTGTHLYQQTLINKIIRNKKMCERYHISAADLQQFFHPARQIHNVGDQLILNLLEYAVAVKLRELDIT